MTADPLLELEARRRLYAQIQDYPGLHVRELARQLETSAALVEYHLAMLKEGGLVRIEEVDAFHRVYATGSSQPRLSAAERSAVAVLRKRIPLRITLYLLNAEGAIPHKRIAADLGLGKSTLSFHLRGLEKAHLVRRAASGDYALTGRPRTVQLLLAHRPTPDLRQEFADLWLALYGGP